MTLAGFLLLAALLLLGRFAQGIPAEKLPTAQDRTAYLTSCGWEVDPAAEEEQIIHIPEHFSAVYEQYNDLQLQQGFDLRDYAGRDCVQYTYVVENYPDESQTVLACLILYRDRLIGGDVHSTNLNGFMIGLK